MENKNSIFTIVFALLLLTSIPFASMEAYADFTDPVTGQTVSGDPLEHLLGLNQVLDRRLIVLLILVLSWLTIFQRIKIQLPQVLC